MKDFANLKDSDFYGAGSSCSNSKEKSNRESENAADSGGPFPWGNPVLFGDHKVREVSSNLLPGIYGEFSKVLSKSMEVPEAMTVFGVLGVVSSAASHRFSVVPKPGWTEPINIYVAVALEPGNLKSPLIKKLIGPLIEWEKEQAERLEPEIKRAISERKTMEKIIDKMRTKVSTNHDSDSLKTDISEISKMEAGLKIPPVLPKVFATDTTPEQLATNTHEQGGRFGIISDEGGIMKVIAGLYSGGNANIDIILKGIDGGQVRIRRKDHSFDLSPYLTFCLFCQPSVIGNMGKEAAFDGNGLVERFLYLVPNSRLGFRTHNTETVPEAVQSAYEYHIRELLDEYLIMEDHKNPRLILKLEKSAFFEWRDFQDQIEIKLRIGGELYPIKGWGGKICGYALRIAGLLHVMEHMHTNLLISPQTMKKALALSALLIDHALVAFNLMGADNNQKKAKAVINWIITNGELRFRKRDCHRALRSQFGRVEKLDEILAELADRNIISNLIRIKTGGRLGIFIDVNPAIFTEIKR